LISTDDDEAKSLKMTQIKIRNHGREIDLNQTQKSQEMTKIVIRKSLESC